MAHICTVWAFLTVVGIVGFCISARCALYCKLHQLMVADAADVDYVCGSS
jgi:hypothetical protein